jgi:hypothetical protein
VEKEAQRRMNIPVFHDDQHGTAIVAGAGLLNALELTGKGGGTVKQTIDQYYIGSNKIHWKNLPPFATIYRQSCQLSRAFQISCPSWFERPSCLRQLQRGGKFLGSLGKSQCLKCCGCLSCQRHVGAACAGKDIEAIKVVVCGCGAAGFT